MADQKQIGAMLGRIAAQLMVLYDDAMANGRTAAAEAYAMALNVVRNESGDVPIRFGGPRPRSARSPARPFPTN
jgi:hypothetical protein